MPFFVFVFKSISHLSWPHAVPHVKFEPYDQFMLTPMWRLYEVTCWSSITSTILLMKTFHYRNKDLHSNAYYELATNYTFSIFLDGDLMSYLIYLSTMKYKVMCLSTILRYLSIIWVFPISDHFCYFCSTTIERQSYSADSNQLHNQQIHLDISIMMIYNIRTSLIK